MEQMHWHDYDLICFDFDGVLVDSEALHFAAYKEMCAKRGISIKWGEREYARYALYSADGLRRALLEEFPQLRAVSWELLYSEKKAIYQELLQKEVALMPGVAQLLGELQGLPTCVVTNSFRVQVEQICAQHPILRTIPKWITREDYAQPKPHHESYQMALRGVKRALGFEDSPRGISALIGAGAEAILVTSMLAPEEIAQLPGSFRHIPSFHTILA